MKYYYDDALAAVWMAKHFGMRFGSWREGKYYLHPDSLPILEPQKGDLVSFNGMGGEVIGYALNSDVEVAKRNTGDDEFLSRSGLCFCMPHEARIIQRDGIAFMGPKVEE